MELSHIQNLYLDFLIYACSLLFFLDKLTEIKSQWARAYQPNRLFDRGMQTDSTLEGVFLRKKSVNLI